MGQTRIWDGALGQVCFKQNDEWAVQWARYVTLETISQVAADVAGYSSADGGRRVRHARPPRNLPSKVLDPEIAEFHGRIGGSAGDSLPVEFASVVNAV